MAIDGTPSAVATYRQTHDTPLTDRILAHLPGPRWLWIAAWAILPVMHHVSLGLGPVGTVVFNAFLIFCAITVPFLFVSLRDRLDLTIGLAFFAAGVVLSFCLFGGSTAR
ncbi:MAG TPA: hypothetical protein VFJ45_06895 [bacterium]|nr:hypothetical protein [bacterium]